MIYFIEINFFMYYYKGGCLCDNIVEVSMVTTNIKTADKLREYFNECGLSDTNVGYILLLEVVMYRMQNPCVSLQEVYTILAEKHSCLYNTIRCSIKAAIHDANIKREAEGKELLKVRSFVTTCVNRYSDISL